MLTQSAKRRNVTTEGQEEKFYNRVLGGEML